MDTEDRDTSMTEDLVTPEVSLSLGDSYYVDEAYDLAVDAYTVALAVLPEEGSSSLRFRALSHRSAAFLKLKRYPEACDDSKAALDLLPTSGLNKGETKAAYRRLGLVYLELGRLDEAKGAFSQAAQLAALNGSDEARYQELIEKCTPESKAASFLSTPKHSTVKKDVSPTAASINPPTPTAAAAKSPSRARPAMPKYQYYQSDTVMTIAILEPNVKERDLQVTFLPQKLTVRLRKGDVDFTVIHGVLFDTVDVDRCRIKILDEKVLLKLRKQEAHEWQELFGKEENTPKAAPADTGSVDEVPTVDETKPRAYASHRDWDAIERNLKQQEKQETPQGDEAVNKLFQQIYETADEDTRRAMVKSFQTSGGTVLSTNWGEVEKTDYEKERVAPQGMEWKNWEGDKLPQKDDK